MPALHETAYPRFKSSYSEDELWTNYTPDEQELALAQQYGRDTANQLRLLVLLKSFQLLGYFPKWHQVPASIVAHLAHCLGCLFVPEPGNESSTRYRQSQLIRTYLDIQPIGEATYRCMEEVALTAAWTKEHLADIVNVMVEELVRQRFELPTFSRFTRQAMTARAAVNAACLGRLDQALMPEQKEQLDACLETTTDRGWTWWRTLKIEPAAPTTKNIRAFLEHLDWLRAQYDRFSVTVDLPEAKRQQFCYEAYACDWPHLKQLTPPKRRAFAVLLLQQQMSRALDDMARMFIRRMHRMRNDAEEKLAQYLERGREQVSTLLEQLARIATAFQHPGSELERFKKIEAAMPDQPEQMLAQCQQYLAYLKNDYRLCLLPLYKSKRSLLFNCVASLALKSSSQDQSLLRALAFIALHRARHKEWLPWQEEVMDLSSISDPWYKLITGRSTKHRRIEAVHRKCFELYVFFEVTRQLKSGDLYVEGSEYFDDYTKHLIGWSQYHEEIDHYPALSGVAVDPEIFVETLQAELMGAADRCDAAFPENGHARIEQGRLILSKHQKKKTPEDYPFLDQQLKIRMKQTGLLDILIQTERWLGLSRHFHHFSGADSRIAEYPARLVSTLFCYGCFLGPAETARSMQGISRKQLAWINAHHVHEQRLNRAITKVINAYNRFQLPSFWGSGQHVSADGTKWSMYQQNLFAEYHLRYGGYGGVGYYHVSDTYIALFSHFIPCGVYEATYILDALIKNQSAIQPDTVHGDTQAQNTVVFALAYLLGIRLMPRIRNIKDLTFFHPGHGARFEHIDALFTDRIDWALIRRHLPDMLRVALSIKGGKLTPSTILRRLGTYSRKNKLYYAFRELGRAVRTTFLLDYVHDVALREIIFAATNKSEEFNQFTDWVAFASKVIPENLRHEQSKIIKYNHLVANLLILYNVDEMTRVFNELVAQGHALDAEMLEAFSPYRTEHINRFGRYVLDMDADLPPLHHELRLAP
jgi:TnpA family transposase